MSESQDTSYMLWLKDNKNNSYSYTKIMFAMM